MIQRQNPKEKAKWMFETYGRSLALDIVTEFIIEYRFHGTSQVWESPRVEYYEEVYLELKKL
jgi:hypothetical protein